MARTLRAARVYDTAKFNLSVKNIHPSVAPVWLKVVEQIPPAEILTRPQPIQHSPTHSKRRILRNMFKPQRITYPEDELRSNFYKDHPWELARPRIIAESDGMDGRYVDWSKGIRQPDRPVTGESVVQRQMWLMENNPNMSKEEAYDRARREFYLVREEEDVTRRIAVEEARMVGAYFGKNRLQIGIELEDKVYESWKAWAKEETLRMEAQHQSMYANFGNEKSEYGDEDNDEDTDNGFEPALGEENPEEPK